MNNPVKAPALINFVTEDKLANANRMDTSDMYGHPDRKNFYYVPDPDDIDEGPACPFNGQVLRPGMDLT